MGEFGCDDQLIDVLQLCDPTPPRCYFLVRCGRVGKTFFDSLGCPVLLFLLFYLLYLA